MQKQFLVDINPDIELPSYDLVLCKLNGEPLQELHNIEDLEIKAYFANIDEISFRIPFYRTENDGTQVKNELFDLVDGSMMVLVNDMKYFILTKPETKTDEQSGEIYKNILGFSREYELAQKQLIGYEGASRLLYDYANQKDESGLEVGFLNYIENHTSWKVDYINANLLTKYRYLNFSKTTLLQAMNEVQKTYGCLFQFNTIDKTISVYEPTQLGKHQGLYISDKNFISNLSQEINHDEIKTRLYLYGKDNISIQSINITGQPYIENYSFYKHPKYMSQSLIDALDEYEAYITTKEGEFSDYLNQLEILNDTLSTKIIELGELNIELTLIQHQLDIAISDGQPTTDLKRQEKNKEAEISNKNTEISNINKTINQVKQNIDTLRESIKVNNFLTDGQIDEFDTFIREDEYSDSNYTEDNLEEFLAEGKKTLDKISHPRIQFDVDVEDFLSLVEGQHIRDKLILGDIVTLEHEELNFDFDVRLVGYTHNPSNHSLKLIFSNRDSVDNANIYLSDLLESVTTTASTVDFNKFRWDKGEDVSNKFTEYIDNYLDLSNQAISKGENQRPILDDRGLWLYKENPDGSIDPRQIRAINNIIALTQDNWNTVDVAITPNGVVAAKLIGNIILGANLKIVSDNGIVEILNNLISIRDDKNRLRVALGNYDVDKYGLLIKDSTGNKTILDEDGILQTWQEGRTDNVDASNPLVLNLYIPDTTRDIRKTILRFKMIDFRSYSRTTESDGSYVDTTASGGGIYDSTSWDGGVRDTTGTNVREYDTSGWEGGTVETSRIDNPSLIEEWVKTQPGGADGHRHDFYKTIYHEHNVTFPRHRHSIEIPGHNHSIDIGGHSHRIDIDSHRHGINIPSHSHDIRHGIYTGGRPSSVRIKVNGIDRTSALGGGNGFTSDRDNLDITGYIRKGQWNTIELTPNTLGRIDATIFNQALMGFN